MSVTDKMRSVNLSKNKKKKSSWVLATLLIENYLHTQAKVDQLYNASVPSIASEKRRHCKFLFYGAIRNKLRIDNAVRQCIHKNPKELLLSIFYITGYELLTAPEEKEGAVIHHAVDQSKTLVSPKEVQFVNAILRKLPKLFRQQNPSKSLSIYYSHPEWLVKRWIENFGHSETEALLKWNQSIPKIHLLSEPLSESLKKTIGAVSYEAINKRYQKTFKNLYTLTESSLHNPKLKTMLAEGKGYIKDPSTLHAVEALNPSTNETVLDLCAAPGGKSFDCLCRMGESGTVVSLDYKEKRMVRLKENLSSFTGGSIQLELIDCDLLTLTDQVFIERGLPTQYDAILLDAPCSNTGVIQRKPDVRWRLSPNEIKLSAELQLQLLTQASKRLKDSGRLVYSTCSIEYTENKGVISDFLKSEAGQEFALDLEQHFYPWIEGHDGAAVFRLIKSQSTDKN